MEKKIVLIFVLLLVIGLMFVRGQGNRERYVEQQKILEGRSGVIYPHEIKNSNEIINSGELIKASRVNNIEEENILYLENSGQYYYYRYVPHLRRYEKINCYKIPPRNKIFYNKCP